MEEKILRVFFKFWHKFLLCRDRVQAFDDPQKAMEDFIDRQKMKKLGTADEIAASAAFLASDEVCIIYSGLKFGKIFAIYGKASASMAKLSFLKKGKHWF